MYTLWTKLTSIEDVLLGTADEVIDYLNANFTDPRQQIHAIFSERAEQIKRNIVSPEITNNCSSCRIIHHEDISFDAMCDYLAFVFYSYNGKNAFIYNGQQYKRGDIIIKNIKDIPNSSSVLKSGLRNPQIYQNLYELFFNSYFKKTLDKRVVGLGIIYEKNKWKFDNFIFGPESKQSPFSVDEHHLIEMSILTWTKNIYDPVAVRDNARKMLDEQLDYVKDLLETQRPDMENIWSSKLIDLAIKVFEYEIEDEILELFQTRIVFNTFTSLRNQIQSNDDKKLALIADIFEHRRLTLTTQSSEPLLCQIWKQLKIVEDYLVNDDFSSLVNFLRLNTFISIETLYSIAVPTFLHQLGIYHESDSFDSTLDYIGLLIYQYNNQEEFLLNQHHCKRGQILIRQKDKIVNTSPVLSYKKTSFDPLFLHEYLYESYFNQKPNEFFQGIGFIYEQGKWKFDVITYAGKYGIHSTYDTRGDNSMLSTRDEQHSIDLILSTIYLNNKWKDELELMYNIDELESIGRDLFRKQIQLIEDLFENKKEKLKQFDSTCHLDLKYFIQQYKPNAKPLVTNKLKVNKHPSLTNSVSIESSDDNPTLINSDKDYDVKRSSKRSSLGDGLTTNDPHNQLTSNPLNSSSASKKSKKPSGSSKPSAFKTFRDQFGRKRASSCEPPTTPDFTDHNDNPLTDHQQSHRSDSVSQKSKEPISLYQLWRELCVAEQKLLHKSDLNEFLKYLADQEYKNSNESNRYVLPNDETDEYNLMAKIKIESQFEYVKELYHLKKSKILSEQINQDKKKQLEDLFKIYEKYYHRQIDIGKKYWKLNI